MTGIQLGKISAKGLRVITEKPNPSNIGTTPAYLIFRPDGSIAGASLRDTSSHKESNYFEGCNTYTGGKVMSNQAAIVRLKASAKVSPWHQLNADIPLGPDDFEIVQAPSNIARKDATRRAYVVNQVPKAGTTHDSGGPYAHGAHTIAVHVPHFVPGTMAYGRHEQWKLKYPHLDIRGERTGAENAAYSRLSDDQEDLTLTSNPTRGDLLTATLHRQWRAAVLENPRHPALQPGPRGSGQPRASESVLTLESTWSFNSADFAADADIESTPVGPHDVLADTRRHNLEPSLRSREITADPDAGGRSGPEVAKSSISLGGSAPVLADHDAGLPATPRVQQYWRDFGVGPIAPGQIARIDIPEIGDIWGYGAAGAVTYGSAGSTIEPIDKSKVALIAGAAIAEASLLGGQKSGPELALTDGQHSQLVRDLTTVVENLGSLVRPYINALPAIAPGLYKVAEAHVGPIGAEIRRLTDNVVTPIGRVAAAAVEEALHGQEVSIHGLEARMNAELTPGEQAVSGSVVEAGIRVYQQFGKLAAGYNDDSPATQIAYMAYGRAAAYRLDEEYSHSSGAPERGDAGGGIWIESEKPEPHRALRVTAYADEDDELAAEELSETSAREARVRSESSSSTEESSGELAPLSESDIL
jgi:hypothetical protein